jgi:hypothetical protein
VVGQDETHQKLVAFAEGYLAGYETAVDEHFDDLLVVARQLRESERVFPLYGRRIGVDTAVAALLTSTCLQVFLVEQPASSVLMFQEAPDDPDFNQGWLLRTTDEIRARQAREFLGLWDEVDFVVLGYVELQGTGAFADSSQDLRFRGQQFGISAGNRDGLRARADSVALTERLRAQNRRHRFKRIYSDLLRTPKEAAQMRGQRFEVLWRDVLESQGWHPRKFRIAGEENDFTAIYQTSHVLGEVRWFAEPINGSQMREFLGKLDPRPATIGLFISNSGFDRGAVAVARRAVNSKTVILFSQNDIEAVLLNGEDPGNLFTEKLRKVYDEVFEDTLRAHPSD